MKIRESYSFVLTQDELNDIVTDYIMNKLMAHRPALHGKIFGEQETPAGVTLDQLRMAQGGDVVKDTFFDVQVLSVEPAPAFDDDDMDIDPYGAV